MTQKIILVLLTIGMPLWIFAQTQDSPVPLDKTGKIRYKEVVEQEGASADLFKRCVKWVNTAYTNPTAVTKVRNMTNRKIVIKHRFSIYNGEAKNENKSGTVLYTMTLLFKDNRYRAEITDFVLKQVSRFPANRWLKEGSPDYHPEYIEQLNTFATNLINSLKKGMQPKEVYQDEEW